MNAHALPQPRQPLEAIVMERTQESPTIFTLRLRLSDAAAQAAYRFAPGQFNMLYLYGVGEVPISIMSDPEDRDGIGHTIRALGRVTRGLAALKPGDQVGLRGPFGRGWPLQEVSGCDVVLVTGGLGCAPVTGAIEYVFRRRASFGHVTILHGVKKAADLVHHSRFEAWRREPNTTVLLTASNGHRPSNCTTPVFCFQTPLKKISLYS